MALLILDSKKAIAFMWLGTLVIILIIGLFYILLNEPIRIVRNITIENVTGGIYEDSYNKINTIWDYFLLIFVLMAMAFLVLSTMRRPRN